MQNNILFKWRVALLFFFFAGATFGFQFGYDYAIKKVNNNYSAKVQ
jgi:hypothetical protein